MTSKRFISLTIALAVATFVASTFAQAPKGSTDKRNLGPNTTPYRDLVGRPDQQYPLDRAWGSGSSAAHRLWSEESALSDQANQLTRQLEAADTDAKRDEIKAKLREALGKQFDARQK